MSIGPGFSSATSLMTAGTRKILVASSSTVADTGTGIYRFISDGDADVEAGELTVLAFLAGSYPAALTDFVFVA